MRIYVCWLVSFSVIVLLETGAIAQTVRLANGVAIKGDVVESTSAGLVVNTSKGAKAYEWETLSPATRYRYDAKYRANYDVILRGLPPSRRDKLPMSEIDNPHKPQQPKQPIRSVAQPVAHTEKSLLLAEQIVYENIEPLRVGAFPQLELRSPESAAYWGIQYGPMRNQILYMAFDSKDVNELRDVVYIYGLADPYKKTTRIKGKKKRKDNTSFAKYRNIELSSHFGDIAAEYDLNFSYTIGKPKDLSVIIGVTLKADGETSQFDLYGQPTDLIYSEGTINVRGLLDLPVLWVSLDPASTSPWLVGDLRMSRMKLCPGRGMDSSVIIEVRDKQSNDLVQRQVVELDESMFSREYGIVTAMSKMKPGGVYDVKASIDLGPFLGEVVCEETIHVPKTP